MSIKKTTTICGLLTIGIVYTLPAVATEEKCPLPCVQIIDNSSSIIGWGDDRWPALISGGGDIQITLAKAQLTAAEVKAAVTYAKADEKLLAIDGPGLFVGGVPLGNDALLVSKEEKASTVSLRYRVSPTEYSKNFWTTVYKDNNLTNASKMAVSLGWRGKSEIDLDRQIFVRVCSLLSMISAFSVLVVLWLFFIWGLYRSDIFRVGKIEPFWDGARSLRRQLWWNRFKNRSLCDPLSTAKHLLYCKSLSAEVEQLDEQTVLTAARGAIAGDKIAPGIAEYSALVGLAITPQRWGARRLPFSLARVQIGTWTVFACSVAVFLWIVYGDLRKLEGSLVGLLCISTATGLLSYYFEDKTFIGPAEYSKGLFKDILTGWDGNQHIHRFQAVIVNVLLLADGIFSVGQNLAYPLFDASWLQFLGISGVAQVAGKTLVENPAAQVAVQIPPHANTASGSKFGGGKSF